MILCVVGPTGVGKTKLSVALAKRYNAIIINCDAMQVYKGLDIGTAKIKEEEKENIEHYLFDFVDPLVNYTVADYQKDVRKLLEKYKKRNIVFVGGTGLYLKAALYDYQFPDEIKEELDTYEKYSNEELYAFCLRKDANCNIHPNNRRRLIRFLQKKETTKNEPKLLYDVIMIGLTTDRETLYKKIDDRVMKMLEEGLVQEVKNFYDKNVHSKALHTAIGYKELYGYFEGKYSFDEAVELIKKNSRHYAKRQYTFFSHQLPIKWFDVDYDDFTKTVMAVESYVEKKKEL